MYELIINCSDGLRWGVAFFVDRFLEDKCVFRNRSTLRLQRVRIQMLAFSDVPYRYDLAAKNTDPIILETPTVSQHVLQVNIGASDQDNLTTSWPITKCVTGKHLGFLQARRCTVYMHLFTTWTSIKAMCGFRALSYRGTTWWTHIVYTPP